MRTSGETEDLIANESTLSGDREAESIDPLSITRGHYVSFHGACTQPRTAV